MRDPIKRSAMAPAYTGPWDVLSTRGMTVTLAVGPERKPMTVNIDRCKKWYSLDPHVREQIPKNEEVRWREVSTQEMLADTDNRNTDAETVIIPFPKEPVLLPSEELPEPIGLRSWENDRTDFDEGTYPIIDIKDDSSSSSSDSDSSDDDDKGVNRDEVILEDIGDEDSLIVEALAQQFSQQRQQRDLSPGSEIRPSGLSEREYREIMQTESDVERQIDEVFDQAEQVEDQVLTQLAERRRNALISNSPLIQNTEENSVDGGGVDPPPTDAPDFSKSYRGI